MALYGAITAVRNASVSVGEVHLCKRPVALTQTLEAHSGTRLSLGIRALRGANPTSSSRDHHNAFTSLAPLEPPTTVPGRVPSSRSLPAILDLNFVRRVRRRQGRRLIALSASFCSSITKVRRWSIAMNSATPEL